MGFVCVVLEIMASLLFVVLSLRLMIEGLLQFWELPKGM